MGASFFVSLFPSLILILNGSLFSTELLLLAGLLWAISFAAVFYGQYCWAVAVVLRLVMQSGWLCLVGFWAGLFLLGFFASGPLVSFGFCVCFSAVLSSVFVFVVRLMLGFLGAGLLWCLVAVGPVVGRGCFGLCGVANVGSTAAGPAAYLATNWADWGATLFCGCSSPTVLSCSVGFCSALLVGSLFVWIDSCHFAAAWVLFSCQFTCATCRLLLFGWQFCMAGSAAIWAFCFVWSWLFCFGTA